MAERTHSPDPSTGWFAALAGWKKVLLLGAMLLMVTGAVLMVVESGQEPPATGGGNGAGSSLTGNSFVPGGPTGGTGGTQPAAATGEEPMSAGFFRLGFSFVAGFCIGLAVRKTLKLAALLVGLLLICLFLLSYFELIEVKWHDIDRLFESFVQRIERESDRFRTFITGSLPAAGLAALGLVAGFKK